MPTTTICAPATAAGLSAIAVFRLSGPQAVQIAGKVFSKNIENAPGYSVHFGQIAKNGFAIDEVLLTVFRAPHSFTGEDCVEISCHGSPFIVQKIAEALVDCGAEPAEPGEFTRRAFLNGKMDLSQAEAVAELIAADSEASHRVAISQLKGGYSVRLNDLREQLIHFASLLELELDFGEEDVEFASRSEFRELVSNIVTVCSGLAESFSLGNALKNGVPTVIAGRPNAGKSTLLNALLNEDRAIVSPEAGTTRDTIEEVLYIDGIAFRLVDTAGIRSHAGGIETLGIERTLTKLSQATVVIYVADALHDDVADTIGHIAGLQHPQQRWIVALNKADMLEKGQTGAKWIGLKTSLPGVHIAAISSLKRQGIDELKALLRDTLTSKDSFEGYVVSSMRHYQALTRTVQAMQDVLQGMEQNLSGDMLAVDVRRGLEALGSITGHISSDDLLSSIFSRFCIGK